MRRSSLVRLLRGSRLVVCHYHLYMHRSFGVIAAVEVRNTESPVFGWALVFALAICVSAVVIRSSDDQAFKWGLISRRSSQLDVLCLGAQLPR
jgi:hypothetical protein